MRHGHFVYESGDHGDTWLDLDLLVANPHRARAAAGRPAGKPRPYAPDVICGPLSGDGLGDWIADRLGLAFACAERLPDGEGVAYVIPAHLGPLAFGKRVAVVDDAINAGATIFACIREIERLGGVAVAAAGLIVHRFDGRGAPGPSQLTLESLAEIDWNVRSAAACLLCRSAIPIDATAENTGRYATTRNGRPFAMRV